MSLIPLKWSAQTDELLMHRAAKGSERAFEELYNRYARRLQGFFARRLGDGELAADLMHDTFLRLYAARHTFHEGRSFRAWIYTIAYNLLRNQLRSQLTLLPSDEADTSVSASVEVELDTAILHEALRTVLDQLPPPYALLFALHYEEGLTVPQVALIAGLPEGTVKSRLHKTLNIIKQKLKPYETH